MASIKERAASLNLAEKLRVRSPAHGVTSKPAQPPSMWSGLIFHLRSGVTVKHRRVHLKTHSDCFLGSEAVDVVAEHMNSLGGFEVSRDQVVCVCQALLDCSVFESVGTKVFGKDKKKDDFQDSKSALYRFGNAPTPSADELEKVLLVNGIQKLFCGPSSYRQEYQTCSTGSRAQLTPRVAKANQLDATTGSLPVEPWLDRRSPSRGQTHAAVPQSLVDELWQEQTLLRLLSLVELPLLEGILQCSRAPSSPDPSHPPANQDQPCGSNHLDRQILKAFRETLEDEWLRAALDCLDFLPDQPVVELSRGLPQCFPQRQESCDPTPAGSSSQDVDKRVHCLTFVRPINNDEQLRSSTTGWAQCKLLLYGALVKHYSRPDGPPLLPRYMTDIYAAIADLLVDTKFGKALEALQLCLKLLPHRCREELRRLLTFMSLAADPQGVKLDKEMENRLAVKKSFSRAVFHSKCLAKEKEDLMVVFMLSNVEDVFKIPGALHKDVSDQLASVVDGKPPSVTGSTFCQQVSSRSYADSTRDATNQELRALLTNIRLDTKISEKERKRLLRQFYAAHPEIFSQHFGDAAVHML